MQIGLVAYSTKGQPDEGRTPSNPQRASSACHRPAHPRRENRRQIPDSPARAPAREGTVSAENAQSLRHGGERRESIVEHTLGPRSLTPRRGRERARLGINYHALEPRFEPHPARHADAPTRMCVRRVVLVRVCTAPSPRPP